MRAGAAIVAALALAACAAALPAAPANDPLLTTPPARCGRERCEGAFYRSDDLEFGRYLIGASAPAASDCGRRAFDCDYAEAGVRYSVMRGRIGAMRIDVAEGAALPLGLRGSETPDEALAAMRAVTSIPMELTGREDGDRVVTVQGSLKNALGRPEWFNLVFTPDDRLYLIEMYGPR